MNEELCLMFQVDDRDVDDATWQTRKEKKQKKKASASNHITL